MQEVRNVNFIIVKKPRIGGVEGRTNIFAMVSLREKCVSLLSTLFAIYITAVDASLEEVERHLEIGKQFLMKGQAADALTQYHAAIELDNDNYKALHGRATCYLATGKSMSALSDLDRVISLKPDFTAARLQRALIFFKKGDLHAAAADYEEVKARHPGHKEAQENLDRIIPLRDSIDQANNFFSHEDYKSAESHYTAVIEACPSNAEFYEKRAICYENLGDVQKVISDVKAIASLIPDSTEAYFKISKLYYRLGNVEHSMAQIRHCLRLNPEHKECFPLYRTLKKLSKEFENIANYRNDKKWAECIAGANRVFKTESSVQGIVMQAKEHLCHCYNQEGKIAEAIKICTEVINYDQNNIEAICDRADALISDEKVEEAIQDYQSALNKNENSARAKEGLERGQKLLKQMQKKDYYKILGVKRNAKKREILKAYRKLAQQWHPDNFPEAEKQAAQKKFIDVAAAKEVLTDPEKRRMFDSGEDPLDPETQQHQHNPFGGFHPFGNGGPFQFKFHFQ